MKAWYFANDNKTLGNGDGRPIVVGETHTIKGRPVLCQHGLHASTRIIDALQYATGSQLYRVNIGGETIIGDDKIVGTKRTYLNHLDAEKILHKFARHVALINIEKIQSYCSKDAYDTICSWLHTGDEQYRKAARSAAQSTAGSAVWPVTQKTALSAALSAVRSADYKYGIREAAWAAVWSAAWSAAWEVAWYAAQSDDGVTVWNNLNKMLTEMVCREMGITMEE